MLSPAQLDVLNRQLWPQAVKAQGWPRTEAAARAAGYTSLRSFRLAKLGELVGHPLASAREIDWDAEFTTVKNALLTLAGDLHAAGAPEDGNKLRQFRHVAAGRLQQLLQHVDENYVRVLFGQRFHRFGLDPQAWRQTRPARMIALIPDTRTAHQVVITLTRCLRQQQSRQAEARRATVPNP